LIYINLPRAFAKRRRPSVEEKGGSAILQIVSAAKWRVSGFLLLEPVRDQLAREHDLQSRHGVALILGRLPAPFSWEASGSIVVRSLIYLKTQPGGPYVLWDVGSIRPKRQKNDFGDAEAIAEVVQRPYRRHQSNPRFPA